MKPALVVALSAYGIPAPQGSKRHVGNGVLIESSKKVRPWREAVKTAARDAWDDRPPLDEPLAAAMVFTFLRPKSHFRTGRNAHMTVARAGLRPAGYPDLDKLARSTGDALKDAGLLRDDGRIAEYLRLAKVWAGEDPDALNSPGVVIRIYRFTNVLI